MEGEGSGSGGAIPGGGAIQGRGDTAVDYQGGGRCGGKFPGRERHDGWFPGRGLAGAGGVGGWIEEGVGRGKVR